MNANAPQDWVATTIFLVAFPTLWCTACSVISFVGGWWQLAKRYRRVGPISGTVWRFQSATVHRFAEASYGGCLKVAANEEGMGLSVFFPFRLASPPLFIPWSEMLVSEVRRIVFFKRVRFTFPDEPSLWIEISPRLAAKIQKAIGCDWFPETGESVASP